MEERLRFVARLLDGEKMAGLCREFGISRKTGYKIFNRYKDCGLEGLTDRSRRPYRHANQLPFQIEKLIIQIKKEFSSWGAPKIRERLRRIYPDVHTPAISTIIVVPGYELRNTCHFSATRRSWSSYPTARHPLRVEQGPGAASWIAELPW
jgi:putative transposase